MPIPILSRTSNILRRHLSERGHYRRKRDWLMSIYNRLLIHLRGLPLPGRSTVWQITPAALDHPLYLRLASSDWYVMEEVFFNDEYGPLLKQGFGDVTTVLDLGTNIGMSVRLWQKAWPGAQIVAVEPDAANIEMAKRNAAGSAKTPHFIQACVAGAPKTVHLDRSHTEYGFRMEEGASGGEAIEAITIPEILRRASAPRIVDLLKCDVEGAEAEIFGDCQEWIARVRMLAVEVHAPYSAAALLSDLARAGAMPIWQHLVDKGDVAVVFAKLRQ